MNKNALHDPLYFAPVAKLGGGWVCFKDSPSPPPSPDYTSAANATATGNLTNLRAQTEANRYNQYTPYGSQTWTQPDATNKPDTWESSIALDPRAQAALDTQLAASNQIGELSHAAGERTADAFSKPFDGSSVDRIADQSYAAQTARLDPQWDQNQKTFDAKMSNQGIMAGSEAYGNAARTFDQGKNDAYTQARQAAISTMPQTYQLATSTRNQPLNEWNAIRTGTQIQNPTFSQAGQQGYTPGPDMAGAVNSQYGGVLNGYNAQVGQTNSQNQQAASLAAAALIAFSDIRLKRNIERVGTHPLGVGIYEYDIFDRRERGVMAQELFHVKPDAVHIHESGYLMVDYGKL